MSEEVDITKLPMSELLADLEESRLDASNCQTALEMGIVLYGDGQSVERRLKVNRQIILKIEGELGRRANLLQTAITKQEQKGSEDHVADC